MWGKQISLASVSIYIHPNPTLSSFLSSLLQLHHTFIPILQQKIHNALQIYSPPLDSPSLCRHGRLSRLRPSLLRHRINHPILPRPRTQQRYRLRRRRPPQRRKHVRQTRRRAGLPLRISPSPFYPSKLTPPGRHQPARLRRQPFSVWRWRPRRRLRNLLQDHAALLLGRRAHC